MVRPPWWKRHFWVRVDALVELADVICLLIFGRYWAWSLKFMAWRLLRESKQGGG